MRPGKTLDRAVATVIGIRMSRWGGRFHPSTSRTQARGVVLDWLMAQGTVDIAVNYPRAGGVMVMCPTENCDEVLGVTLEHAICLAVLAVAEFQRESSR